MNEGELKKRMEQLKNHKNFRASDFAMLAEFQIIIDEAKKDLESNSLEFKLDGEPFFIIIPHEKWKHWFGSIDDEDDEYEPEKGAEKRIIEKPERKKWFGDLNK